MTIVSTSTTGHCRFAPTNRVTTAATWIASPTASNHANIKLDKSGGLTEALALAADARGRGLSLMVGCMMGTGIAMAPAYVVASLCEVVDLDAPLVVKNSADAELRRRWPRPPGIRPEFVGMISRSVRSRGPSAGIHNLKGGFFMALPLSRNSFRILLGGGALLFAAAPAAAQNVAAPDNSTAPAAVAQNVNAAPSDNSEIIVTAQRRAERLAGCTAIGDLALRRRIWRGWARTSSWISPTRSQACSSRPWGREARRSACAA